MGAPKRTSPILLSILFFTLAIVLASYMILNSKWVQRMRYPLKYEQEILEYSREYSVDPYLTASIIWVESRFLSDAVSNKEAKGLMQILPSTARWAAEKMGITEFDETMLLDSKINIRIGCWYLGFLTSQFPDNLELVLASYNGGIGNVQKWLGNREYSKDGRKLDYIPFQETRNYVVRVLEVYEIYKGLYPFMGDLETN